jgi:hypothetical protein
VSVSVFLVPLLLSATFFIICKIVFQMLNGHDGFAFDDNLLLDEVIDSFILWCWRRITISHCKVRRGEPHGVVLFLAIVRSVIDAFCFFLLLLSLLL